jgi:lipoprotein-anchoring transpeptidase ErfK/SrfK
MTLNRRAFCWTLAAGAISTVAAVPALASQSAWQPQTQNIAFTPIDPAIIAPQFRKQAVQVNFAEWPGTIVVDTNERFLYLLLEDGLALRYGVGVGREGFGWSGEARVGRKQEWPTWTPPAEMVARDPQAAKWVDGMPGGPDNPLGARALYLFEGDRDTLFRIHGTNAPETIGKAVSSGCIRMLNEHVVELYRRTPEGAKVIVLA